MCHRLCCFLVGKVEHNVCGTIVSVYANWLLDCARPLRAQIFGKCITSSHFFIHLVDEFDYGRGGTNLVKLVSQDFPMEFPSNS